jgi:hypothetical protein
MIYVSNATRNSRLIVISLICYSYICIVKITDVRQENT